MSLIFSVPGKTFLAGEYLALKGGPTLVALSSPCFEIEVKKGAGSLGGIHQDSPAGVFIRKHSRDFAKVDLSFKDPYGGVGGFGASTAQFLGVYAYWLSQEAPQRDMERLIDFKELLETYYECAWSGVGQRPSGADLVGQYKGSLTFFDKNQGLISVKSWPFADLDFVLIHTGNKVATHEHLKTLADFNSAALEASFKKIRAAFETAQSDLFISGIQDYAEALRELNFTCAETLALLTDIRRLEGVRAAKGCGALGADVVLVVIQKGLSAALQKFCGERGLSILSSADKISLGLQVRGVL